GTKRHSRLHSITGAGRTPALSFMQTQRTYLLAVIPTILVPGMLLLFPKTVWHAAISYHAYCLAIPLLFKSKDGLRAGVLRDWLPLAGMLAALTILVGEFVLHFGDVRVLLPPGWQ